MFNTFSSSNDLHLQPGQSSGMFTNNSDASVTIKGMRDFDMFNTRRYYSKEILPEKSNESVKLTDILEEDMIITPSSNTVLKTDDVYCEVTPDLLEKQTMNLLGGDPIYSDAVKKISETLVGSLENTTVRVSAKPEPVSELELELAANLKSKCNIPEKDTLERIQKSRSDLFAELKTKLATKSTTESVSSTQNEVKPKTAKVSSFLQSTWEPDSVRTSNMQSKIEPKTATVSRFLQSTIEPDTVSAPKLFANRVESIQKTIDEKKLQEELKNFTEEQANEVTNKIVESLNANDNPDVHKVCNTLVNDIANNLKENGVSNIGDVLRQVAANAKLTIDPDMMKQATACMQSSKSSTECVKSKNVNKSFDKVKFDQYIISFTNDYCGDCCNETFVNARTCLRFLNEEVLKELADELAQEFNMDAGDAFQMLRDMLEDVKKSFDKAKFYQYIISFCVSCGLNDCTGSLSERAQKLVSQLGSQTLCDLATDIAQELEFNMHDGKAFELLREMQEEQYRKNEREKYESGLFFPPLTRKELREHDKKYESGLIKPVPKCEEINGPPKISARSFIATILGEISVPKNEHKADNNVVFKLRNLILNLYTDPEQEYLLREIRSCKQYNAVLYSIEQFTKNLVCDDISYEDRIRLVNLICDNSRNK